MTRRSIWLAVLGAALSLYAPAAASADKVEALRNVTSAAFLEGSNGYGIVISAVDHEVSIDAVSPTGEEATYTVRGLTSTRRLKGNFGRFGSISLRLVPGRTVRHVGGKRCSRHTETVVHGTFKGTIHFQGEQGYTSVTATHARGEATVITEALCFRGGPRGALGLIRTDRRSDDKLPTVTSVGAARRQEGRGIALTFETDSSPGLPVAKDATSVGVLVSEHRGRVKIDRSGIFEPPPQSLQLDRSGHSITGTLTLPAPFEGEAQFTQGAGDKPVHWTGDLRVPLPGAPEIPLAGPGFRALFCEGVLETKSEERCSLESIGLTEGAVIGPGEAEAEL